MKRKKEWGDKHYCDDHNRMPPSVLRQELKIILRWYGWAIENKNWKEDVQIRFCPFCGEDL